MMYDTVHSSTQVHKARTNRIRPRLQLASQVQLMPETVTFAKRKGERETLNDGSELKVSSENLGFGQVVEVDAHSKSMTIACRLLAQKSSDRASLRL